MHKTVRTFAAMLILVSVSVFDVSAQTEEKQPIILLKADGPADPSRHEYKLDERIAKFRATEMNGQVVIEEVFWKTISNRNVEIEVVPERISATLSRDHVGLLHSGFEKSEEPSEEGIVLYFKVAELQVNYAFSESRKTENRESMFVPLHLTASFTPASEGLNPNTDRGLVQYLERQRTGLMAKMLEAMANNNPIRFYGTLTLQQREFASLQELDDKGIHWHLKVINAFNNNGVLINDRWE